MIFPCGNEFSSERARLTLDTVGARPTSLATGVALVAGAFVKVWVVAGTHNRGNAVTETSVKSLTDCGNSPAWREIRISLLGGGGGGGVAPRKQFANKRARQNRLSRHPSRMINATRKPVKVIEETVALTRFAHASARGLRGRAIGAIHFLNPSHSAELLSFRELWLCAKRYTATQKLNEFLRKGRALYAK